MTTWSHPDLGNFEFDSYCWRGCVTLPAFKTFQYRYRGPQEGSSEIELQFEADDEEELPSEEEIEIAKRIIQNEASLASKLLIALYDDLHGKGPSSGMWWHGDVESIYEDLEEETGELKNLKLDHPEALANLLGSPGIMIQKSGYGYDYPLATLTFNALFEIEHGIGILTDGKSIIGTGYMMDASPFI